MSHKFFGVHGKRYAWCGVCLKVLKWAETNQKSGSWNHPFDHCGKAVFFVTDEKAHELLKGRPRRSAAKRMKAAVERRGSRVARFGH